MLRIEKISPGDKWLHVIRELFNAYAAELDVNLSFQSFTEELADPFSKYGEPFGALYIALYNQQIAGCIALQKLDNETCEMKRLFVKPEYRKHKIGEALVQTIIEDAKSKGYKKMVLDTLDKLQPAIRLYKRMGFTETNAYYTNPLPGVVFMEMKLLS